MSAELKVERLRKVFGAAPHDQWREGRNQC
jgi:hypothetical protein